MTQPPLTALDAWNASPGLSAWLAGILTSREGRLLMGVLRDMAIPTEDFSTIESITDPVVKMAMRHTLVSGQQLTLTNMLLLARMQDQAPLSGAWEEDAPR